jgi:hypothetical protein
VYENLNQYNIKKTHKKIKVSGREEERERET